jgi:hypothetical protein
MIEKGDSEQGYESEGMVAQVQAKYAMASALRSPGPASSSSAASCMSPVATDPLTQSVNNRYLQHISGHLQDIAGSLRGINQTLGGNPSRVAAAMRKLQDGSLGDSDDEDEDDDDGTGTPPPSQKKRKISKSKATSARKRPAAQSVEPEEIKSDEEEEEISTQAATQPLAAASSDLVAAAAAPAGTKPSGLLKGAKPAAKKK